ncbi:dTDP-4-dehydrorhamnose reductase [Chitinispirillum alkaliphilum]|nr:dTDP-4-dehydrorhamnose reductase [Chitinispirillum alkaliphilum]
MIWVTGSKGMLGSDLIKSLEKSGQEVIASDIEVDITNRSQIFSFVEDKAIKAIVNCSAYTAVDNAEDEREKAFCVNEKGPGNLAGIARLLSIPLLHISTDYVFDGTQVNGLTEDMKTKPIGVYGQSKLAGEIKVRQTTEHHFIIRTSWLYGKHGTNFVSTMIKLMNERDRVGVVSDQWGSPTWTRDLSQFITHIITHRSEQWGIYHFSNEGRTSWYEFACSIYELGKKYGHIQNSCHIVPISTKEFPTRAKRPVNSFLTKHKAKQVFQIEIPEWQISLNKFLRNYQEF